MSWKIVDLKESDIPELKKWLGDRVLESNPTYVKVLLKWNVGLSLEKSMSPVGIIFKALDSNKEVVIKANEPAIADISAFLSEKCVDNHKKSVNELYFMKIVARGIWVEKDRFPHSMFSSEKQFECLFCNEISVDKSHKANCPVDQANKVLLDLGKEW